MFQYEEYYKLYNVRSEEAYQKRKEFLAHLCEEGAASREKGFREKIGQYLRTEGNYLLTLTKWEEKWNSELIRTASLETFQKVQEEVYGCRSSQYHQSYVDPVFASHAVNRELGPVLSKFAMIFSQGAEDALMHRRFRLLKKIELYFSLWKLLQQRGMIRAQSLEDLYEDFFARDSEEQMALKLREMADPNQSYKEEVLLSDEEGVYPLYESGVCVGDMDLKRREFILSLPEEQVEQIASTLVRQVTDEKPGRQKRCVGVVFPLGTERIVRRIFEELKEAGYVPFVSHVISSGLHPDYLKMHRRDAQLSDANMKQREENLNKAVDDAAPLIARTGHILKIRPLNRNNYRSLALERGMALGLDKQQREALLRCPSCEQIRWSTYLLPVPENDSQMNSEAFHQYFRQMLEMSASTVNRLRPLQVLSTVLDKGDTLYLTGWNGNETDLAVTLHPLENEEKETNFNTSLGDSVLPGDFVYTVPARVDTNGVLHVRHAIIGSQKLNDVRITIEDGMVSDITYEDPAVAKASPEPSEGTEDPREEKESPKMSGSGNENRVLQWLRTSGEAAVSEFAVGVNTKLYVSLLDHPEMIEYMPEDMLACISVSLCFGKGPYDGISGKRCFINHANGKTVSETGEEGESSSQQVRLLLMFDEIGRLSVVKDGENTADVMREGLFVPVGMDTYNQPLIQRRYQKEAQNH